MLVDVPATIWSYCLLFRNMLTAPQLAHFARCLTQRLIYTPRHHTLSTLQKIFSNLPVLSNISRFFSTESLDRKAIRECRLEMVAKKFHSRQGTLIVDDVTCEKTGTQFEDLGIHWSGMAKEKVPGHNFVTTLLKTAKGCVPYDWREYFQESVAKVGNFKTKLTLATEMIDHALKQGLIRRVLADSWYGVRPFLKDLQRRGLQFICDHRIDRTIVKIDDCKTSIKAYVDSLTDADFLIRRRRRGKGTDKIRYHCTFVHYYGVGKLKMIVSQFWDRKTKTWKKPRVILCNVLYWSALKILAEYAQRWGIEVFHREAKQSFGLGDYQVQTTMARHTHVELVFVASVFRQLQRFRLFGKSKAAGSTDHGSDAPLQRQGFEETLWQVLAAQKKGTLREFLEVNKIKVERFKPFL